MKKSEWPQVLLMLVSAVAYGSLLLASGCACWQPQHPDYNAPKCVVARQAVDCTTEAVKDNVAQLLPVVQWIIKGADRSSWDTEWITNTLMAMGFQNVGCILAALENDFLRSPMAAPSKEHLVFEAWKKKHPGIAYKLPGGAVVK